MSDLAFVTGASGFVGSALARALAAKGFSLRLAVRASSKRDNLDGVKAQILEGLEGRGFARAGDSGDDHQFLARRAGALGGFAGGRRAISHAAETDARDFEAGPSEI